MHGRLLPGAGSWSHWLRGARWPALLAVWLGYLGLAGAVTWPLAWRARDSVFGLGTPPLNVWAIGWVLHQLPRDPLRLFDGNVFYPYPRSLAFSEHLLVPSLLSAPWAVLTGNLVLAHNAVALLTLAFAGLGMFLLGKELVGDSVAAFGGGLLYAFHTWNVNELIRLQILSNAWFPFALLALVRYSKRPGWRPALAAGAACVAQGLSCMYWALYLPFVIVPAVFVLAAVRRDAWRRLVPLLVSLGVAACLIGVFFVPYVRNALEFGSHRSLPAPIPLDRYLDVLPGNVLYADMLGAARVNENAAHFLGFSTLLLAAIGLRPGLRSGPWFRLALAYAAGGLLLSLGPRIQAGGFDLLPGPYALLYEFAPGFRSVRYPERFALVLVLGLAPLVAAGLAQVRSRLIKAAACVVLFLEHFSAPLALEPLAAPANAPSVYRWLASREDVRVVAEVPSSGNRMERFDALPMYYSTLHWKPTPQGFTGYFPPACNFIRWRLFHFPSPDSLEFLRKFGVDTLVVRGEGGPLPDWARPSEDWAVHGPFAEGDVALRLRGVGGLGFTPLGHDDSGLVELDAAAWQAWASHPGASRAHDRSPETSWSTVAAARRRDRYVVRFRKPTVLARVSIEIGAPFEFPTSLELIGRTPDKEGVTIAYDAQQAYDRLMAWLLYRPREARLDLDVTTPPLMELRLRIARDDAFSLPWTMSELRLFVPAAVFSKP